MHSCAGAESLQSFKDFTLVQAEKKKEKESYTQISDSILVVLVDKLHGYLAQ